MVFESSLGPAPPPRPKAIMVPALTHLYRDSGRTIIFTTHHLDEAEALSDRVAFLEQGRLRCCAPPFCLTEAYGQGLSLTLNKQVGS